MRENILWLPSVVYEDYPYLSAAAEVRLVNERVTQLSMSLPSKVRSHLSSGGPIVAAVPMGEATARYLEGVAYLVLADDHER